MNSTSSFADVQYLHPGCLPVFIEEEQDTSSMLFWSVVVTMFTDAFILCMLAQHIGGIISVGNMLLEPVNILPSPPYVKASSSSMSTSSVLIEED
jgi:hypothetical protein